MKKILISLTVVALVFGAFHFAGAYAKRALDHVVYNASGVGSVIDSSASILESEPEEIIKDLLSGKTVGEIVEEAGISDVELKSKVYAEFSAFLDAKIKDGALTQAGKEEMLQKFGSFYDSHIDHILSLDGNELSKWNILN